MEIEVDVSVIIGLLLAEIRRLRATRFLWVREILDFARFVTADEERADWAQLGREQLSRAYGPDEPEYTLGDLKPTAGQ